VAGADVHHPLGIEFAQKVCRIQASSAGQIRLRSSRVTGSGRSTEIERRLPAEPVEQLSWTSGRQSIPGNSAGRSATPAPLPDLEGSVSGSGE
jgi:hypothetical protein